MKTSRFGVRFWILNLSKHRKRGFLGFRSCLCCNQETLTISHDSCNLIVLQLGFATHLKQSMLLLQRQSTLGADVTTLQDVLHELLFHVPRCFHRLFHSSAKTHLETHSDSVCDRIVLDVLQLIENVSFLFAKRLIAWARSTCVRALVFEFSLQLSFHSSVDFRVIFWQYE